MCALYEVENNWPANIKLLFIVEHDKWNVVIGQIFFVLDVPLYLNAPKYLIKTKNVFKNVFFFWTRILFVFSDFHIDETEQWKQVGRIKGSKFSKRFLDSFCFFREKKSLYKKEQ